MVEWPIERANRLNKSVDVSRRINAIPRAFLNEIEQSYAFKRILERIIESFNENAEAEIKIAEIIALIEQPDLFGDRDISVRQVVLALACVSALKKHPTFMMWEYLWSLAWHSSELETHLPDAVVEAAKDAEFRQRFFSIAQEVIGAAAHSPGRRAPEHEKAVGPLLREQWKECPNLSSLWRGNFGAHHFAIGRDDDGILSIVSDIDPIQYVELLSLYDYPDPVAYSLMYCGASWKFDTWKAITLAAPRAFDETGRWNGSMILPLLLPIAHANFDFHHHLGQNPAPEQVSEVTNEIETLAGEVAKTILERQDSLGCSIRWGNWLVRTTISAASANPIPFPQDASSRGFVESALLDELINRSHTDNWTSNPAPDAESWEPWCQLAVAATSALERSTPMPSASMFLKEWNIKQDEWPSEQGRTLIAHSGPFDNPYPRADGYGVLLLAMPLVETGNSEECWRTFWHSTASLREIVEFGDPDEDGDGGWQGRHDASRLLIIQFSIGLMMLDYLFAPQRPLDIKRQTAIEGLLPILSDSVSEMLAIDQLNSKFWSEALRHLAIRRASWTRSVSGNDEAYFNVDAKPTLADFVRSLAGDTENLIALAYSARCNNVESAVVAKAFDTAAVDLEREINIAQALLSASERAIGLNQAHLDTVREILQSTPVN